MKGNKSVYIIAEAGVNHNGDIDIAKRMIEEAVSAGADAVKFQTFCAESLVCFDAPTASYQKENANADKQLDMLKKLEMDSQMHSELYAYCGKCGIDFLSTPFDLDSITFLEQYNLRFWKIPSGEITDYPYLVRIAKAGIPVLLSTGMSTMEEVKSAVAVLEKNGVKDITVLHCNTEYPTPLCDVNLLAMVQMREELLLNVGYSDHTVGIETAIAAAALGASVIEKHFTLDKNMEGPDHKASIEPKELSEMVQKIRNIEVALGDGIKKVSFSEKNNIEAVRKSIVASRDIKKGEVFQNCNIAAKRPGNGLSPMLWREVIGKVAKKDYQKDERIIL